MHNFIYRAEKQYYELQFSMFKSFEEVDALVEFEEQGQQENAMKIPFCKYVGVKGNSNLRCLQFFAKCLINRRSHIYAAVCHSGEWINRY